MKMEEKQVRSKSEVVGVAKYEIFDSVTEAVDSFGEVVVLDLINSQNKTNKLNGVRSLATGKPSKTQLRTEALGSITAEEFASVAGDIQKLTALIEAKVRLLETEHLEKQQALAMSGAETVDSDEDDEDDD